MPDRRDTTIRLRRETKQMLDGLKIHPRETYDEVIRKLVEACRSKPSIGSTP
jgi:predicted DNA-binding protein